MFFSAATSKQFLEEPCSRWFFLGDVADEMVEIWLDGDLDESLEEMLLKGVDRK